MGSEGSEWEWGDMSFDVVNRSCPSGCCISNPLIPNNGVFVLCLPGKTIGNLSNKDSGVELLVCSAKTGRSPEVYPGMVCAVHSCTEAV